MFEPENLLQQAVSAFAPSDAVVARVKDRIRAKTKKAHTGVVLVCVNQNSQKIFKSVFKKYNKLMQKIA